jgi:alpha-galactosidase
MAAPLVYSGDMTKLDEFTLNVLCNPEIIEVNQDPLGECGLVIKRNEEQFIMIKNLQNGSKAVGLFNRGKKPVNVSVDFSELKLAGKQPVRDLWREKDLRKYKNDFTARVPGQGVVMVKVGKTN